MKKGIVLRKATNNKNRKRQSDKTRSREESCSGLFILKVTFKTYLQVLHAGYLFLFAPLIEEGTALHPAGCSLIDVTVRQNFLKHFNLILIAGSVIQGDVTQPGQIIQG